MFFNSNLLFANQANEAHNKHNVFPVPVGDSNSALTPSSHDWITYSIYFFWDSYGVYGK